jgi:hypothetical protein
VVFSPQNLKRIVVNFKRIPTPEIMDEATLTIIPDSNVRAFAFEILYRDGTISPVNAAIQF